MERWYKVMSKDNLIDMDNSVLAYCRKSEEDKKRQILSLDDQVNECDKLISDHNLILTVPHFKEEKSAKKAGQRVEFYRMLSLLKSGKAKVIVCWNANRLARNMIDGSEIIDLVQHKGLRIITPYTQYDLSNWFMLLIEFGMSTDFSLKLSKDVKRGLESKVAKGIRPGLTPLGYLNHGKIKGEKSIVVDSQRYELCARWWQMMLTGKYTVEQSLKEITTMGLRDRRGDKISRTAAFKIFHNIFYAGYFQYLGQIHKGIQRPMVTLDEFNKVQDIITGKFGGRYKHETERKPLPLSGFIKCSECNATITCERKTKHYKNGTTQEFSWYRCKKNKEHPCSQLYMPSGELEKQVGTYIDNLELDLRFISWIKTVLRRRNQEEFEFDRKQRELLTKKLQELSTRKEMIFGMKIDGLYSELEYKQKVTEVLREEVDIKEKLNSNRISYWEGVIDQTLIFAETVFELFNSKDPYVKRLVLQILGSDLKIRDKNLYLEAKSVFIFLRNKQNQLYEENGIVGLKERALQQANMDNSMLQIPIGAGEGTRTPDVHFGKVAF